MQVPPIQPVLFVVHRYHKLGDRRWRESARTIPFLRLFITIIKFMYI